MKSVIAEANTIAKAIELGWQKAGCPGEFTVKIFQEPQRNLFGITKFSAKVGIFFDDQAISQKIKPLLGQIETGKALNEVAPAKSQFSQPAPSKPKLPRIGKPQPVSQKPKVESSETVPNNPELEAKPTGDVQAEQPVRRKRRRRRFRKPRSEQTTAPASADTTSPESPDSE